MKYVPKIGDWLINGDAIFAVESLNFERDVVVSMNCVLTDDCDYKPEDGDDSLVLSLAVFRNDEEWSISTVEEGMKERIVEAAVDAMCKSVQDDLGSDDGGPASMYFSGENGDEIREVIGRYFDFEYDWNEDDGTIDCKRGRESRETLRRQKRR